MAMTYDELLGSLGIELLATDSEPFKASMSDHGAGRTVSAEIWQGSPAEMVTAMVTAQLPPWPEPVCLCIVQAEPRDDGFVIARFNFYWKGTSFGEADACAFIRAIVLELKASRMPDLDDLLAERRSAA